MVGVFGGCCAGLPRFEAAFFRRGLGTTSFAGRGALTSVLPSAFVTVTGPAGGRVYERSCGVAL
jgi:hypothetical protein